MNWLPLVLFTVAVICVVAAITGGKPQ